MEFEKPDPSQQRFWEQASLMYHSQIGEKALSYLVGRGINMESVDRYRLGYVGEPVKGHEMFQGMLCIPYIKKLTTVSLKFRCIQPHDCKEVGHSKYLNEGNLWLYNTAALDKGSECDTAEGELDVIIMEQLGRNVVGIPGVDAWKSNPHWRSLLRHHTRGFHWCDNDTSKPRNYGVELGKRITKDLPRMRMVIPPDNHDPTSTFMTFGPKELFERAGLEWKEQHQQAA